MFCFKLMRTVEQSALIDIQIILEFIPKFYLFSFYNN